MDDNLQRPDSSQRLILIIGAIVVLALMLFAFAGAGNRVVESDADLPPLASPPPPSDADNLGTR